MNFNLLKFFVLIFYFILKNGKMAKQDRICNTFVQL